VVFADAVFSGTTVHFTAAVFADGTVGFDGYFPVSGVCPKGLGEAAAAAAGTVRLPEAWRRSPAAEE